MDNGPARIFQYVTPLHIDRLTHQGNAQALTRVTFTSSGACADRHDERWLQNLIFRFPQALPAKEIVPGLGTLVSICLELPIRSLSADNSE